MIDSAGTGERVHRLVRVDGSRGRVGVGRSPWVDVWVRRCSTLMVAGVAAYSSYEHQRHFAAVGGADPAGAKLWPLSVDGLLLLASTGLLRTGPHASRRTRAVLWAAFILGIAVSLAANIAAAPILGWQPILVAGWPPVALLLAVELLADHPTPTTGQLHHQPCFTAAPGASRSAARGRPCLGPGRQRGGGDRGTADVGALPTRTRGRTDTHRSRPGPHRRAPTTTAAPSSPAGDTPAEYPPKPDNDPPTAHQTEPRLRCTTDLGQGLSTREDASRVSTASEVQSAVQG
jgi:hypothetical protein